MFNDSSSSFSDAYPNEEILAGDQMDNKDMVQRLSSMNNHNEEQKSESTV